MNCPACGHENRDTATFCGGCGESLARDLACSSCGAANPPGQRFCDACGKRLEAPFLVSSVLRELTSSTGDLRFGSRRDVQLKGLSETQNLYPVEWNG